MRNRNLLNLFKTAGRNQRSTQLFKLFPILIFVLTSVLFSFPVPLTTAPGTANAGGMSSSGHGFQSPQFKTDINQELPTSILTTVSCVSIQLVIGYNVDVLPFFQQFRVTRSGIRAPPFQTS